MFNEPYLRYHLEHLGAVVKCGNFAQDFVGDWYVNLAVEIDLDLYRKVHFQEKKGFPEIAPNELVGIDPGCKTMLTLSHGQTIESPAFYQKPESVS